MGGLHDTDLSSGFYSLQFIRITCKTVVSRRYFDSTNGGSSAVDLVWSLKFVVINSLSAVDVLPHLHSLRFNIFGAPSRCMLELFLLSYISIEYRF